MKNYFLLQLVACLALIGGMTTAGCMATDATAGEPDEDANERADSPGLKRTLASEAGTPLDPTGSLLVEFDGSVPYARIQIPSSVPRSRDFRVELDCTFVPEARIGNAPVGLKFLAFEEGVYYTTAMHIARAEDSGAVDLFVTRATTGWPPEGSTCMLRTSPLELFSSFEEVLWDYSVSRTTVIAGGTFQTLHLSADQANALRDNSVFTGWTPNSSGMLLAHGLMAPTKLSLWLERTPGATCPEVEVGRYGILQTTFDGLETKKQMRFESHQIECTYDLIDVRRPMTTHVLVDTGALAAGKTKIVETRLYGMSEVELRNALSPYAIVD